MGEKIKTKKYLILVIVAMAIIIILLSGFMLFYSRSQGILPITHVSSPTPTPYYVSVPTPTPNYVFVPTATPTPQPTAKPTTTSIPAFSLILSTSTPTVDIPIHQQSTQFEVTLTQNGAKTLQFPCTVAICSPSPYNIFGATRSLIDYQVINGYGN
jgi:hypothetical protein